jgi:hypothetical protein
VPALLHTATISSRTARASHPLIGCIPLLSHDIGFGSIFHAEPYGSGWLLAEQLPRGAAGHSRKRKWGRSERQLWRSGAAQGPIATS